MYTRSRQDNNYKDSANFDYETRIIRLSPSLEGTTQPTSRATDKNNNNNEQKK